MNVVYTVMKIRKHMYWTKKPAKEVFTIDYAQNILFAIIFSFLSP